MSNVTLSDEYVTDTMALVLHLENRKSSQTVGTIFKSADQGKTAIHIPAMAFAEILYLSERRRIRLDLFGVEKHLDRFPAYKVSPMTFEIVRNAGQITDIPELHDRLIAATAYTSSLQLITNDPKIQASTFINTVW